MKKILIVDDTESIAEKWREALKNYKPGELSPVEAAHFERMRRIEQASQELKFCLPPCKKFPNCDCGKHNSMIYRKFGLD